jgi:UDP-glucose 4-epimerase
VLVTGGAGFIGSHLVDALLGEPETGVTVVDDWSSGRRWHLERHRDDPRLTILTGDLRDLDALTGAVAGHDLVYHLASNPDIARAATEPDVDFWLGTYLTQNLLEAMRRTGVRRLCYTSGSGIYGDTGTHAVGEDHGPLAPISTYGASKLAGEALIGAYCHMFGFRASVLRMANVVGSRQTHGVAYDFLRKLQRDPSRLEILGDGAQSKSYVHVSDVVRAMDHVLRHARAPFEAFNVATDDYLDVRAIARLVVEALGLADVKLEFTGGARGWTGDVPVIRFDLTKIHALGWRATLGSAAAMRRAIEEMLAEKHEPVGGAGAGEPEGASAPSVAGPAVAPPPIG